MYASLELKAIKVDPSLKLYVQAEKQKAQKLLEEIEKKFRKAEEKKSEEEISQMTNLLQKLFPGNNLQERSENFLNYYLNDNTFIEKLYPLLDPFDSSFNVIIDE